MFHQSRRSIAVLFALAITVTTTSCASPTSADAPGVVADVVVADAVMDGAGVQHIDIIASDDLRLTPTVVRAQPGSIELRFRNVGATPHSFAVRLPGSRPIDSAVTGNLNDGQSEAILMEVATPGRYDVTCVYHESSGMQGMLDIIVR